MVIKPSRAGVKISPLLDLLRTIRSLLYGEGYTIRGVQRLLKERGVRAVMAMGPTAGQGEPVPSAPMPVDASEGDADDATDAEAFADMTRALRVALDDIEDARRILRSAHAR